jgi:hypothetical protein
MNSEQHLVLHGLAIKKYAQPEAIASLLDLPVDKVSRIIADGVARGSVQDVAGKFTVAATARVSLQANHSRYFGSLRSNEPFQAAYQSFEKVNVDLKALITDWQTMKIGGKIVPNDHSDEAYDEQILKRLAKLHRQAERILDAMAAELPRMRVYRAKLEEALANAEDGRIEWVSDAKIESYHTMWFELHEDLLCMMGQQRTE